jgi:hypothetical protein
MTAAKLLADLALRGIRLEAHGGRLRFHPRSAVSPDLLGELKTHKAVLLARLCQAPDAAGAVSPPAWSQAEAEGLLAELHRAMIRVEWAVGAGKAPPVRLAAMRTWFAVAEGYIRDRELEAARGWDALKLLRDAVQAGLSLAERGPPPPAPSDPAHEAELCRWLRGYFNRENVDLWNPPKSDAPALCSC